MDYQNSSDDGDGQQLSPQDKSRKRNELQRDITIMESDFKKKTNEKVLIESEIRSLKKDEARIRVEIQERQTKLNRVDQDVMQMDSEVRALRKKLNLI